MPIFEFRCNNCGKDFEHLAMQRDGELEICCPGCGGEELTRLMSAGSCRVEGGSSSAPAGGFTPGVESRSCPNSGNCSTLTLPGHTR